MVQARSGVMVRHTVQPSNAALRWRKAGWQSLILLIFLLLGTCDRAAACAGICGPPHNEIIPFLHLEGQSNGQAFRLAGFGVAIADHDVANCGPEENPNFDNATLVWKDFRFYAKIPGLPGSGIVKGTLNQGKVSAVVLTANDFSGNGGLFPASLTNRVYLRLLPVDWPGVEYRNTNPVVMYTSQTFSAPPDSSVITHEQSEVVFTSVGLSLPGFPSTLSFAGGEQRFLDPTAIELDLLSTTGGIVNVQLSNPLSQNLAIAYFLHIEDLDPMADMVAALDGVRAVPAHSQTVLSFDLHSIPVGGKTIIVDAMVLDPMNVAGHDRLRFNLAGSASLGSGKPGAAPSPGPGTQGTRSPF
jgi:hypothetical protein